MRAARFFGLTQLGLLALSTTANSARAADLVPAPPPPSMTAQPWSGIYAGSLFGYGLGTFRSSQAASRSRSEWGPTGGVLLGYGFQSGPFVFGPEADLTLNSIRAANPGVAPGLPATISDSIDTSRIRARLGYDLGQFLPFVAGGVAFNELYDYNAPLTQFGERREVTGYTLGAGLEWRFALPIIGTVALRGEYVYDAYPTETFNLLGGPVRTRYSDQTFRVALMSYPGQFWSAPATESNTPDWSGSYAGALGGGLWTQTRTSLGGVATRSSAAGPEFGVFGGHNFMFGQWMLGVEGATALANARGSGAQPSIAAVSYQDYFETDLRGRAGYAFGRFLPYVTLGGAWSRSQQIDLATGSDRSRVPSEGVIGGAGLEYMLSDRWSARVEYLLDSSYKNQVTGLDGLALSQSRFSQTARVGLAYYFH
jgi:opacity protein-like surface antigen